MPNCLRDKRLILLATSHFITCSIELPLSFGAYPIPGASLKPLLFPPASVSVPEISETTFSVWKSPKAVAFAHALKSNWSEVMVNGVRYLKTAQIGRGGSSKVFRVVAPDCEVSSSPV